MAEAQRAIQCVSALVALHSGILSALSECARASAFKQRVGGLFLKLSPEIKRAYEAYFSTHPAFARLVAVRRAEVDACLSAIRCESGSFTANDLIISLSAPFNRLEKYSSLLKEVERHTDVRHSKFTLSDFSICLMTKLREESFGFHFCVSFCTLILFV